MNTYLETSSNTVSLNWDFFKGYYEKYADKNEMIARESSGGELSLDVVFRNWRVTG